MEEVLCGGGGGEEWVVCYGGGRDKFAAARGCVQAGASAELGWVAGAVCLVSILPGIHCTLHVSSLRASKGRVG